MTVNHHGPCSSPAVDKVGSNSLLHRGTMDSSSKVQRKLKRKMTVNEVRADDSRNHLYVV